MKINRKEIYIIGNCLNEYLSEYFYQYTKEELEVIEGFINKLNIEWRKGDKNGK